MKCGSCGATDDLEATDPRLPATSVAAALAGHSSAVGSDALATGNRASAGNNAALTVRSGMRVESVTVVALQRPEDGGLLLRVLPNMVARRDGAPIGPAPAGGGSTGAPPGASSGLSEAALFSEDLGEAPPEPASQALVSRLKAQPVKAEVAGGCEVCVICSDDFAEAGAPVVVLACGHTFHDACIREWLTRRHTCPTCRWELEVDDVRYLRSIGLVEEADALEKVEKERQAEEQQKQAAERQRWVESMRRGDPVHFGLSCGHCAVTPLVGSCYRCQTCDGYMLCKECFDARQARLEKPSGNSSATSDDLKSATAKKDDEVIPKQTSETSAAFDAVEDCFHMYHEFAPFGANTAALSDPDASGESGAGLGSSSPGGMLTVLVRTPARASDGDDASSEPGSAENGAARADGPGEAAMAAAEVAFAAVRSLALAPLATASLSASVGGGSSHGAGLSRWPVQSSRQRGGR